MSLLQVHQLTASYGAVPALFNVHFDLKAGEVLALLGRNGMGKTTTVKAICRMITARGRLTFKGQDLLKLPSFQVARLGIGLVPEGRRCFRDLTVFENLMAAARGGPWDLDGVCRLFPRLGERLTQGAESLSGGEQQMLAIGRALMTNPSLLILDEATEGLAPLMRQEIWSAIRRIKSETGVAILLIDKSIEELSSVADQAVIIARGTTAWRGHMSELTPKVMSDYVGI